MMEKEIPEIPVKENFEIAVDTLSWVQSACADLANGDEAQADLNYNDKDTLGELIRQKVFDEAGWGVSKSIEIMKELRDYTYHEVIKEICNDYIEKHKVKPLT